MAWIAGELESWPSKDEMTQLLSAAGLRVTAGQYAIRVCDHSEVVFREYGGDLGQPVISADADSVEELLSRAEPVSRALAAAGLRHRFEFYDDSSGRIRGYLHHDWPNESTADM